MLIAEHIGNLRLLTEWGEAPLFDEEQLLLQAVKLDNE